MQDNEFRQNRLQKADALKEAGMNPYANGIKAKDQAFDLIQKYDAIAKEDLENVEETFEIAGRVMAIRSFGKAGFIRVRDVSGEFQIYLQKGKMGEFGNASFKNLDVGDFIFVKGVLFRTKTDQLSLKASEFQLVTKALQTLPEKWHGLTDVETRYRRRYVDLIANSDVQKTFMKRSKIVSFIRHYFESLNFLEVETPMMHPIPGGAAARPFVTHHNTLDRDLYLRIAPELYLKRLVVGGFDRVFEINRNFRNEGISTQHNPEFTMLEFYQAYATYEDLMDLTEDLFNKLANEVCGSDVVSYQGKELSFAKPFARLSIAKALEEHLDLTKDQVQDKEFLIEYCQKLGFKEGIQQKNLGQLQILLFEEKIEEKLIQPTFVTQYPTSVSPLSRRNDENPDVTDRFELFINGKEIANAFSELNDPVDQRNRFLEQVQLRDGGDDEAMYLDEDYVLALKYYQYPKSEVFPKLN